MIQNVRETGKRLKVRTADRLRVHFLALGRRILSWQQSAGFRSDTGLSIGVTSSDKHAGRTVVAFNLAAALASLGNGPVLYVETQYSQTGFARKVPRPGNGLSEVLKGSQPVSACICNTNVSNLFVMSCGRIREQDAAELPVEALDSINPELGNTFDYIVYDLPVASDTDLCYPIAQRLDGVLIVNESNVNEARLQRILNRLRDLQTSVIGIVLNKT